MSDRRDDDPELEPLLAELAETLSALQSEVEPSRPGRTPPLRPPSLREVMRFTERQTIPTLVAILEANVRLLELAGAALRAMDPERSVTEEGSTLDRALEAGNGVSTDRLASGLTDLRDALAGAEATNPEARELLTEADRLSAEVRDRLRESTERESASTADESTAFGRDDSDDDRGDDGDRGDRSDGVVSIDVMDAESEAAPADAETANPEQEEADEEPAGPDIDAELDSIREEVRGGTDDEGAGDDEEADKNRKAGENGQKDQDGDAADDENPKE